MCVRVKENRMEGMGVGRNGRKRRQQQFQFFLSLLLVSLSFFLPIDLHCTMLIISLLADEQSHKHSTS